MCSVTMKGYLPDLDVKPSNLVKHRPSSAEPAAHTHLPRSRRSSAALGRGSFQQDSRFQPRVHPQKIALQITPLSGCTPGNTRWLNVASVLLQNKTKDKGKAFSIHFHFQGSVQSWQIQLPSVLSLNSLYASWLLPRGVRGVTTKPPASPAGRLPVADCLSILTPNQLGRGGFCSVGSVPNISVLLRRQEKQQPDA